MSYYPQLSFKPVCLRDEVGRRFPPSQRPHLERRKASQQSSDSSSSSMPSSSTKPASKKKLFKSVKRLASKFVPRKKEDDYEDEPSFFDDPCFWEDEDDGIIDLEEFNAYRETRGLPETIVKITRGRGPVGF